MKRKFVVPVALALLCLGISTQAAITIDTVPVGDQGNNADTHGAGYGSVAYNYNIGKYEVTTGQYTAFLNAVAKTDTYELYRTSMDTAVYEPGCGITRTGESGTYTYSVTSDRANRPVNFVSYWDACRFTNWLHNGQPTGVQDSTTTERGAYTLDGFDGHLGQDIGRNAGWRWAIASEDEWYKAAYYKGDGTNSGYWDYPTRSNTAPSNVVVNPTDPGNCANYKLGEAQTIGAPYYRTIVGEFENSASPYGTFDQGGNVFEWNDTVTSYNETYSYRGQRGGSYNYPSDNLRALHRGSSVPTNQNGVTGFRIVQAVPEPSSLIALAGGLASLLAMRRRRG